MMLSSSLKKFSAHLTQCSPLIVINSFFSSLSQSAATWRLSTLPGIGRLFDRRESRRPERVEREAELGALGFDLRPGGRSYLEGSRLSGTLGDRNLERFGEEDVVNSQIVLHRHCSSRVASDIASVSNLKEVAMGVKTVSRADGVSQRVKPRLSHEAYLEKLGILGLNLDGSEIPDPRPMEVPVKFMKRDSVFDHMRMQESIRKEVARLAEEQGHESEDEAEDFDLPEEREPFSRHEYTEMHEEKLTEIAKRHNAAVAKYKADKAAEAADRRPMAASTPVAPSPSQGPAQPAREALDQGERAGDRSAQ